MFGLGLVTSRDDLRRRDRDSFINHTTQTNQGNLIKVCILKSYKNGILEV